MGGTIALLQALRSSGVASRPETQKDRWLSEHLDRSFSKEPEESDLPSIMEVVFSKGLHYTAQVYGIRCAPDIFPLKIRFRIIPSFLSQSLRASFWATVIENLEESKDRLFTLPPPQGQTLSNQELFADIIEHVQRAMDLNSPIQFTDSEDDSGSE